MKTDGDRPAGRRRAGYGVAALCAFAAAAAGAAGPERGARMDTAIFGAGCFWCVEAVYERVGGVIRTVPGYAGGAVETATYRRVSRGDTGHAEVVRVEFDPDRVRYRDLVDLFWRIHDPTSLNRQGADVGTQYRSVIFTLDDGQRADAEASRAEAQAAYPAPIVTEIVPAPSFTEAEPEHHGYYRRNPDAAYCRLVIRPKLDALGTTGRPPAGASGE